MDAHVLPSLPYRRSAAEVVSPALGRMKHQLFAPFRFGKWLRLAVISFLSGEMGGCNLNLNLPYDSGGHGGGTGSNPFALAPPPWESIVHSPHFLALAALVVFAVLSLGLLLMYVGSVFRFILFDAVAYNRAEIGAAWSRWSPQGGRFFGWMLVFMVAWLGGIAVLLGIPGLVLWRHYHEAGSAGAGAGAGAITLMVLGVLSFLAFLVAMLVTWVLGKDFLVPLMALENLSAGAATRRLWRMLGLDKGGYAIYIVMKMLLAIASAIVVAIAAVIGAFVVLLPVVVLGILLLSSNFKYKIWDTPAIVIAVLLGLLALGLLLAEVSLVSVPVVVFFQSYVLYFFGDRYPRVAKVLATTEPPPPSPPAPPPYPIVPPAPA
jgi:hypothetical protein